MPSHLRSHNASARSLDLSFVPKLCTLCIVLHAVSGACASMHWRLCLTRAPWVQGGHFHVNMKTNAEVITELESHGFVHDSETTQRLRGHTKLPWLSKTVLVFHKASQA